MNLYLMSATSSLRPDWTEYAKAPTAPSNYKDPEKIQAYIESKRAGLEQEIEKNTRLVDFHQIRIAHYKTVLYDSNVFSRLWYDLFHASSDTIIIGDRVKTILNWMQRSLTLPSKLCDSAGELQGDFFWAINYGGVKYVTLDEFMFSAKERDLLLTDKLIPVKRENYRDDINYMRAALQTLGFNPATFQCATYDVDKDELYGN